MLCDHETQTLTNGEQKWKNIEREVHAFTLIAMGRKENQGFCISFKCLMFVELRLANTKKFIFQRNKGGKVSKTP